MVAGAILTAAGIVLIFIIGRISGVVLGLGLAFLVVGLTRRFAPQRLEGDAPERGPSTIDAIRILTARFRGGNRHD